MVVAPSAPPPTLAPLEGDTVHFKLSSCDLQAPLQDDALSSHSSGSTHGKLTNYRGPECYIKPQTKSNRKIIKNAICYVCLAGEANLSLRQRALAVSGLSSQCHRVSAFYYNAYTMYRSWRSPMLSTSSFSYETLLGSNLEDSIHTFLTLIK